MGYIVIPEEVININITDSSKLIYIKLVNLAYNQIYSYPKISELAKALNISESTVKRATKELREKGLIKVYRRTLRSTNHYIIVPIEWVNLDEEVPESEQYIEGEENFNEFIDKVKRYYEGRGSDLAGTVEKYRPKERKCLSKAIEEAERKLKENDYNFTTKDYVALFAKFYEERYRVPYNINWGRDMATVKAMFNENTVQGYEAMLILKKYVDIYDEYFKNHKYPLPMLNHLRVGFIFKKVAKRVLNDIERNYTTIDGSNLDYKGRVF